MVNPKCIFVCWEKSICMLFLFAYNASQTKNKISLLSGNSLFIHQTHCNTALTSRRSLNNDLLLIFQLLIMLMVCHQSVCNLGLFRHLSLSLSLSFVHDLLFTTSENTGEEVLFYLNHLMFLDGAHVCLAVRQIVRTQLLTRKDTTHRFPLSVSTPLSCIPQCNEYLTSKLNFKETDCDVCVLQTQYFMLVALHLEY